MTHSAECGVAEQQRSGSLTKTQRHEGLQMAVCVGCGAAAVDINGLRLKPVATLAEQTRIHGKSRGHMQSGRADVVVGDNNSHLGKHGQAEA